MIINKNITFIVLAYNHEQFIEESLLAIEKQTIPIAELIISNDASQDGTREKIKNFIKHSKIPKIIYIDNEINKGLINCFNACLQAASGDIVLLQAGDDFSCSSRAEVSREYFLSNRYEVLCSSYKVIDENSSVLTAKIRNFKIDDPKILIIKGASVPLFGMAFTRNFKDRMNSANSKLKNEDDFIGMAAVIHGGILVISDVLYNYRIHSHSLSSWNNIKTEANVFLEKYFNDQPNRIQNLLAWRNMIADSDEISSLEKETLLKLVEKKIDIKICICSLRNLKVSDRFKTLFFNIEAANLQDAITLIFGINGLLLIRFIRRLKLGTV